MASMGARLRAVGRDPASVIGGTIGALLVVVPLVVLVGLLAVGGVADVGGLLVIALLVGCGAWVWFSILAGTGGASDLELYVAQRDLVVVPGSGAPDYAGSVFADGSHAVAQAVRTKHVAFAEVGERYLAVSPAVSRGPRPRQVYLRGRLAGDATQEPDVDSAMHKRLYDLVGAHWVEVNGDELSVFGDAPLRTKDLDKLFRVLADLVAEVDATCVPAPQRSRKAPPVARRRNPLLLVAGTLALLVLGGLAFAVVGSLLGDSLHGHGTLARIVVWAMVLVTLLVVGGVVRWMMGVRRG